MAISSYMSFLMVDKEDNGQWTKLIDIKDFPDLGGDPEMLETTTLSDKMTTNIPGIQSLDALTFTANYTLKDYKALKAMENKEYAYAVWMGGTEVPGNDPTPTGSEGKHKFRGKLSVFASGAGVNEVVDMSITIAASTVIDLDET